MSKLRNVTRRYECDLLKLVGITPVGHSIEKLTMGPDIKSNKIGLGTPGVVRFVFQFDPNGRLSSLGRQMRYRVKFDNGDCVEFKAMSVEVRPHRMKPKEPATARMDFLMCSEVEYFKAA